MSLVCINILKALFIISAIIIIVYDYKYQKIPFWVVIVNYTILSGLINYWLLFGLLYLIFCKIKDVPIDMLYVLVIFYLIIITNYSVVSILVCLICAIYVIISRKASKISFMVPLEISIIIMLLTKG